MNAGETASARESYFIDLHAGLTLAEIERVTIEVRLAQLGFHLSKTADSLGISRTTLWRRIRSYGLADYVRRRGRV